MEKDIIASAPSVGSAGGAPVADAALTDAEESAWRLLVETGTAIRAPIVARREEKRRLTNEHYRLAAEAKGRKASVPLKGVSRDSMKSVPPALKRWVILRMNGMSFKRATAASGVDWVSIQEARAHSEEFRCALAAQEENSRQLMMAKAQSIVELSQDEDAKVSMAQTQVSMRILESLDRDHFGERRETAAEEVQRAIGGGGFVINLIGDAAKVAEAVPEKRPGKALVFTDV